MIYEKVRTERERDMYASKGFFFGEQARHACI